MNIVEQARQECLRVIKMHRRFPTQIGLLPKQYQEFRAARKAGVDITVIYNGERKEIPVEIMKDVNCYD
jgi:hypothetical protein